MITHLAVRAYKGLREFSIVPRRVNLLIGANGTGKTNFTDLIAFVADVCSRGLADVVKDQSLDRIRTRQPGAGKLYKLKIELGLGEDSSRGIKEAYYRVVLAPTKDLRVEEEALDAVVYRRKAGRPRKKGFPLFDTGQPVEVGFTRAGTKVTGWKEGLLPAITEFDDERELVLAAYARLGDLRTLCDYVSSWRVYNIDATVAKQSTGGSDVELERYGANIVPYLARVLQDRDLRERLLGDLREAVPYIQDVQPERVLTYQTLRFLERDPQVGFRLPDMSDGTIRLMGMLAVLRQSVPPAVLVIEEPENAMHQHAVRHFLEVARRVAKADRFASQVFLTSHSPAVVDAVLSPEAMSDMSGQTGCFVTQRRPGQPSIVPAPESVMKAIAENLGRPSDFQREGSFGDEPIQLELPLLTAEDL